MQLILHCNRKSAYLHKTESAYTQNPVTCEQGALLTTHNPQLYIILVTVKALTLISFRSQELGEKKKKKKRKGKLPKNYNPSVDPDPERWLPRRERSTWKGRRKDKRKDNIGELSLLYTTYLALYMSCLKELKCIFKSHYVYL